MVVDRFSGGKGSDVIASKEAATHVFSSKASSVYCSASLYIVVPLSRTSFCLSHRPSTGAGKASPDVPRYITTHPSWSARPTRSSSPVQSVPIQVHPPGPGWDSTSLRPHGRSIRTLLDIPTLPRVSKRLELDGEGRPERGRV